MKNFLLSLSFSFFLLVAFSQVANPASDLSLCDFNNDGFEEFDLTSVIPQVIGSQTNVTVSFYATLNDVENGINVIPSLYTNISNPQTIFVRVEEDSTGNYDTTSFDLIVYPSPIANTPQPLRYCDPDNDGFGIFNLTDADLEITGGNPELAVTYHETLANAENFINAIYSVLDYNNIIANTQTLYARVENTTIPTDCITIVELQLIVEPIPQIVQPSPLVACEDDLVDGFTTFDLTSKLDEILNGLDPLQYIVSFYETETNALASNNPIANTASYVNTLQYTQIVWVRVEDSNTVGGCYGIISLELVVDQNCEPESVLIMQNGTFNACNGLFTDSGGLDSNYSPNEDYTITICPENEENILGLNFTSFATQINLDILSIYDGDDTSANLIGDYSAVTSPGLVLASPNNTSGCLTITFVSNATGNTLGWQAEIICYEPCEEFTPSINVTSHDISNSGVYIAGIGETISLEANTINGEATFNYNWDFGDGNMIDGASTTYQFMNEGTFDVTLSAALEGSYDCIETEAITVVVLDENVVVYPTEFTVEELISDVFLGGQCSQISNITFSTGTNYGPSEPNGIGYFQYAGSNFPFAEGLVLSSGNASDVQGPNNVASSAGSSAWPGDADLNDTVGIQSNNATFIEFDFVPVVNSINFNFLMASEEYNGNSGGTFECNFSDAFAFLLTDSSGITTNLAVLPGTTTPILVTNIHPENPGCAAINEEYFGGYIPQDQPPIAYDGRTVAFSSQANVNIGETYHIKLVIADAGDTQLDSAVFLQAGSLDIGDLCDDIGLINMTAFNDSNVNGTFDNDETKFTNGSFTYEKNNDGVVNVVNSSNGSFTIVSTDETDTYDITYSVNEEYTNCYSQTITSFENVSVVLGELAQVEFPIEDNLICEDLGVYLINPFDSPRPGFEHTNLLYIENLSGVTIASGSVEFVLDENLVINNTTLSSSNLSITSSGTGFTIDFTNLGPSQSEYVDITLFCPTTVELGEFVINTASYTTATNDTYVENNVSTLSQEVVGSYDPNDKAESQGPRIVYDDFIASDEWLYYTIRFQNLGTAEAIFVRIEDALDDQLDESTFQMLRSSHDYVVTRTERDLEWYFEDINLPAEQDDAEGSNGFVYFRVKPLAGYGVGDVIPNTAAIYFDFNLPVITNTFNTIFVESLSVTEFDGADLNIYPNPANSKVTISLNNTISDSFEVTLVDIQGKIINVPQLNFDNSIELDVSSLNSGLYFVQLRKGNATLVEKLVIE